MGAAGIVLDVQLALLEESRACLDARRMFERADGSETVKEDGYRFIRPKLGLPGASVVAGQDAYLANVFARRFKMVARCMGAFRPEAMADAGALPFIALALLDGPASVTLLGQCQERFGDRPWGVRILGFADDTIRQAQLEAIAQMRPTHTIVAGGRPAQVTALEDMGITTFLHAPSPTLLEQFLEAGVRRFIFEGAECGGHIGPRNSFPLRESQLDVVQAYLEKTPGRNDEPIELIFAGGIHDAISAAAAMTLTISLPPNRIRVGLLKGTAYLFTAEAVQHDAIGEAFQRQLMRPERPACSKRSRATRPVVW